jgi:ribonucleotide monophosphatase NagD (HAD superfamily)
VIVGDAGDEFTPRNIQSAFRLLRGGARFVAMHKNRWWITPAGVTLDSGATSPRSSTGRSGGHW